MLLFNNLSISVSAPDGPSAHIPSIPRLLILAWNCWNPSAMQIAVGWSGSRKLSYTITHQHTTEPTLHQLIILCLALSKVNKKSMLLSAKWANWRNFLLKIKVLQSISESSMQAHSLSHSLLEKCLFKQGYWQHPQHNFKQAHWSHLYSSSHAFPSRSKSIKSY